MVVGAGVVGRKAAKARALDGRESIVVAAQDCTGSKTFLCNIKGLDSVSTSKYEDIILKLFIRSHCRGWNWKLHRYTRLVGQE